MSQKLNRKSSQGFSPIIIIVVVVAILAVLYFVFKDYIKINFKGSVTNPNSYNSAQTSYSSKTNSFYSLSYPSNWTVKENPGKGFDLLISSGENKEGFGAIYTFSSPTVTLESQLATEKSVVKGSFTNVEFLPERKVTVEGNNGYELGYLFTTPDGYKLKGTTILLNKNFRTYGITFQGSDAVYNKHYSTVFNSFDIK